MWTDIRRGLLMLLVLSVVTGFAYPLIVTGVAQGLLPSQANGSLIEPDGKAVADDARDAKDSARAVGSSLIGQPFADPKHFWSRPSATSPYPNNASSSSSSNQGPTNPALTDAVGVRIKALRDADPGNNAPVPVDLVTASASGLDPHISPAAAEYQVGRVAKARNLDSAKVRGLVANYTEGRQLGFLGEPGVNVLELNLALDALK